MNYEDKIKEILKEVYQAGFQKLSSYDGNLNDITLDIYVSELSSLLQESNEEAVGKFYQAVDDLLEIEGDNRLRDFVFEIYEKKKYLESVKSDGKEQG
jgi:Mg2+/Co2+ transporter CorB